MDKDLKNIYLIGMEGVGKSTLGRLLANHLKWAFVDFNEILEAIYNRPINEINNTFEINALRNIEENILAELSRGLHQVFACNSDLVIKGSKLKLMDATGITIWIDAPTSDLLERIEGRDMEILLNQMAYLLRLILPLLSLQHSSKNLCLLDYRYELISYKIHL